MRKYIVSVIINFVLGTVFWYGAFSFVTLETNPLKWSEATRLPFVLFFWVIPSISSLISCSAIKVLETWRNLDD